MANAIAVSVCTATGVEALHVDPGVLHLVRIMRPCVRIPAATFQRLLMTRGSAYGSSSQSSSTTASSASSASGGAGAGAGAGEGADASTTDAPAPLTIVLGPHTGGNAGDVVLVLDRDVLHHTGTSITPCSPATLLRSPAGADPEAWSSCHSWTKHCRPHTVSRSPHKGAASVAAAPTIDHYRLTTSMLGWDTVIAASLAYATAAWQHPFKPVADLRRLVGSVTPSEVHEFMHGVQHIDSKWMPHIHFPPHATMHAQLDHLLSRSIAILLPKRTSRVALLEALRTSLGRARLEGLVAIAEDIGFDGRTSIAEPHLVVDAVLRGMRPASVVARESSNSSSSSSGGDSSAASVPSSGSWEEKAMAQAAQAATTPTTSAANAATAAAAAAVATTAAQAPPTATATTTATAATATSAQPSPPPLPTTTAQPVQWTRPVCTLLNDMAVETCEVCAQPRVFDEPPPEATPEPQAAPAVATSTTTTSTSARSPPQLTLSLNRPSPLRGASPESVASAMSCRSGASSVCSPKTPVRPRALPPRVGFYWTLPRCQQRSVRAPTQFKLDAAEKTVTFEYAGPRLQLQLCTARRITMGAFVTLELGDEPNPAPVRRITHKRQRQREHQQQREQLLGLAPTSGSVARRTAVLSFQVHRSAMPSAALSARSSVRTYAVGTPHPVHGKPVGGGAGQGAGAGAGAGVARRGRTKRQRPEEEDEEGDSAPDSEQRQCFRSICVRALPKEGTLEVWEAVPAPLAAGHTNKAGKSRGNVVVGSGTSALVVGVQTPTLGRSKRRLLHLDLGDSDLLENLRVLRTRAPEDTVHVRNFLVH